MGSPASALASRRTLNFLSPITSVLAALLLSAFASGQTAFVRVNQVGYVAGGAKRAYLMASAAETGAMFVLKTSSGSTVFGPAAIGANLGSWSTGYPNVYALDFDSFVTAGTYSIAVSGSIAATSPSFSDDLRERNGRGSNRLQHSGPDASPAPELRWWRDGRSSAPSFLIGATTSRKCRR